MSEPTTTTEHSYLSPQQYALALGYKKKLESALLQKEIRDLHSHLAPEAEVTVTIEETTTTETDQPTSPAEPTTPLPPHVTSLQLPPAPEERHYSPVPLDRQTRPHHLIHPEPAYSAAPAPRNLPHLDRWDPESVKRWATARWPEPESIANRRKNEMEREVYGLSTPAPGQAETPHQRRLRQDRERKRTKRNSRKQPKAGATGAAVRPAAGL